MARDIKWTQWSPQLGMIRCGSQPLKNLMEWLKELGMDAKKSVMRQEKPHAIYGRIIHDENEKVSEVRFYVDTYVDDDELYKISKSCPRDLLRVAHK